MKKRLVIIMACVVFITSLSCYGTTGQVVNAQLGFDVKFNGESIGDASVLCDNVHYISLRKVFEKMGAFVFYRSNDCKILALSRDGDTIYHTVGSNEITVNGKQKVFENPSILQNNGTYIPIDMMSAALNPDRILYDNKTINIQKYLFNNNYHKIIKDVLDVCQNSDFIAERFQRYIDYHIKVPAYSMQEVVYRVNIDLDYPFYENITTIGQPYELLVLVNKYHQLPSNFEQYNLVNMKKEYTVNDGKQYLLAGVAYDKYVEMADAARKDGLAMRVISAYRTESYQRGLYNNKLRTTGRVNADNYSARPGHSEHQTGLAVDINTTRNSFENTAEFRWLQKHAHEYGYILRYPKGKEWITGYSYEPWHYRYVGVNAAKTIYEEGITFEEYYAKYVAANEFL